MVTNETEDEERLIELLLDKTMSRGEGLPLAAVEPILIAARMTQQPADWPFTARILVRSAILADDEEFASRKLLKQIRG